MDSIETDWTVWRPRRKRALLIFATLALAAWVAFLAMMMLNP
jgi:hypothetical protein